MKGSGTRMMNLGYKSILEGDKVILRSFKDEGISFIRFLKNAILGLI